MEHSRSASIGIPTRVGFVSSPLYIRNLCAVSKVFQASNRSFTHDPACQFDLVPSSPLLLAVMVTEASEPLTLVFFFVIQIFGTVDSRVPLFVRWRYVGGEFGDIPEHPDFKILSRTGPLLPHCHSVCPPTNNLRPRHSPLIQHRKKGQWRTPSCKLCTTVFANTARRLVWVYHLSIVGR